MRIGPKNIHVIHPKSKFGCCKIDIIEALAGAPILLLEKVSRKQSFHKYSFDFKRR